MWSATSRFAPPIEMLWIVQSIPEPWNEIVRLSDLMTLVASVVDQRDSLLSRNELRKHSPRSLRPSPAEALSNRRRGSPVT